MKIKLLDLSDPQYAEAIYHFCNDDKEIKDDCLSKISNSFGTLSIAEYVNEYRYKEFCLWYHLTFCDV